MIKCVSLYWHWQRTDQYHDCVSLSWHWQRADGPSAAESARGGVGAAGGGERQAGGRETQGSGPPAQPGNYSLHFWLSTAR